MSTVAFRAPILGAVLALLAATDAERLMFKPDGTFKILHLSDVHYRIVNGSANGDCRDIDTGPDVPCSGTAAGENMWVFIALATRFSLLITFVSMPDTITEACGPPVWASCVTGTDNTTDFIRRLIQVEQPDIVVHTGDIVDGDTHPVSDGA